MAGVGYRFGVEADHERQDWDGAAPRPLAWSAWYPGAEEPAPARHPAGGIFDAGDVALDAALAREARFPVVLMSHGTGGSPESLGWLARHLARAGYVVIGAHHHGNTAREAYRPEGFLCWWERPLDLSALLTALALRGPFAGRLDLDRVSAVGFSLGGYSTLALAGARGSVERFVHWASSSDVTATGPREMPDAATHIPRLLKTSEVFRTSWARQEGDFRDGRVRSVVAIAPAPPVRAFDPVTVAAIVPPVTLITGEADEEAPSEVCADWLAGLNAGFRRVSMGRDVGHYTFLGLPQGNVGAENGFLFADRPGIRRAEVHARTAEVVCDALMRSG